MRRPPRRIRRWMRCRAERQHRPGNKERALAALVGVFVRYVAGFRGLMLTGILTARRRLFC